jgi:hypothetical protein
MKNLIILFGLFAIMMAGAMALRPKQFAGTLLRYAETVWMQVLAAAVRIGMGVILVLYAAQSNFPLILQIIGWIAIAAGVVIALMPAAKFTRLINWAFERFSRYARIAAVFGVLFGAFLIYAVI